MDPHSVISLILIASVIITIYYLSVAGSKSIAPHRPPGKYVETIVVFCFSAAGLLILYILFYILFSALFGG